jgi:hypothetical protein
VAEPTLDDLIEFWIGRCRSTLPESEHHRRVMATATHLRRLRALDAAVHRVRHAGGSVLLAFNDWPAYHSPLADGERRKALNALAEAIAALDAGGGA